MRCYLEWFPDIFTLTLTPIRLQLSTILTLHYMQHTALDSHRQRIILHQHLTSLSHFPSSLPPFTFPPSLPASSQSQAKAKQVHTIHPSPPYPHPTPSPNPTVIHNSHGVETLMRPHAPKALPKRNSRKSGYVRSRRRRRRREKGGVLLRWIVGISWGLGWDGR